MPQNSKNDYWISFPEIGLAHAMNSIKTEYMTVGTRTLGLDEFTINGSSSCPKICKKRVQGVFAIAEKNL